MGIIQSKNIEELGNRPRGSPFGSQALGPERLAGLRGQGAIDGAASMNGQALSQYFPDDSGFDRQIGSPWPFKPQFRSMPD